MKYSNEQLKELYFGAYRFSEDEDGLLKAYQYTAEQMEYLRGVSDFYYERSDASTASARTVGSSSTARMAVVQPLWQKALQLKRSGIHQLQYGVVSLFRRASFRNVSKMRPRKVSRTFSFVLSGSLSLSQLRDVATSDARAEAERSM